jgi:hypothetical protein
MPMPKETGNKRTAVLGIAACFLLGAACLAAAIFQTRIILHLVREGYRTEAMVVGIDKGTRGAKWAVYRFTTETGATLTIRDAFSMYLVRPHRGESLTVLYDPFRPSRVTSDLGIWTWQGPALFAAGSVFLLALGFMLIRAEEAR